MIIDLSKVRADAVAKAAGWFGGTFQARSVADGNVAILLMDGEQLLFRKDVTIAEARALQKSIGFACMYAKHTHERVHSLVQLMWCKTDGRSVREFGLHYEVRGRIAERTDTAAHIAIEPEQWQRKPREGWPTAGWYRFDGWPVDHDPRRRGWRVVSGIPEAIHAR